MTTTHTTAAQLESALAAAQQLFDNGFDLTARERLVAALTDAIATLRALEAAVARRSPEGAERAALEKIAELADGAEGDGDPEWTLGEIDKIAEAALSSPTREP